MTVHGFDLTKLPKPKDIASKVMSQSKKQMEADLIVLEEYREKFAQIPEVQLRMDPQQSRASQSGRRAAAADARRQGPRGFQSSGDLNLGAWQITPLVPPPGRPPPPSPRPGSGTSLYGRFPQPQDERLDGSRGGTSVPQGTTDRGNRRRPRRRRETRIQGDANEGPERIYDDASESE